jgi:hypothetical protein
MWECLLRLGEPSPNTDADARHLLVPTAGFSLVPAMTEREEET